jgi:hypothetical protein
MRALLIVANQPISDHPANLPQSIDDVGVEHVLAVSTVERAI